MHDWIVPDNADVCYVRVKDEYSFPNPYILESEETKFINTNKHMHALNNNYVWVSSDKINNDGTPSEHISYQKRSVLDYSSRVDMLIIDNSKWCGMVKHMNPSSVAAVIDAIEYKYNKECGISNEEQVVIGDEWFEFEKLPLVTKLIHEISPTFSEFIGFAQDAHDASSRTLIVNNNIIEGVVVNNKKETRYDFDCLKGTAYGDTLETILLDVTDYKSIYILKHKTTQVADAHLKKKATKIIQDIGEIAFDLTFTCDDTKIIGQPTIVNVLKSVSRGMSLFDECDTKHYAVQSYSRLFHSLDSIRAALFNAEVIIAGVQFFEDIHVCGGTLGPFLNKKFVKPILGSMCICVVGFDDYKKMFKFKSSLSSSWGYDGYGFIPYSYFTHGFMADLWVVSP